MDWNFFRPNRYTTADRVNAPAPKAMADRSIVIHKPQGTRSLMLVTTRPLRKTSKAAASPIVSKTAIKPSQARSPGDIEGYFCLKVEVAMIIDPPSVECNRPPAPCLIPHAGGWWRWLAAHGRCGYWGR